MTVTENELLIQILGEVKALGTGQTKIESRLDKLEEGQSKIESRLDKLEEGQTKIESRLDKLEEGQAKLETDLRATRTYVELTLPKQIQAVAEQHVDIVRKLNVLADYPVTKERVATLEGQIRLLAERVPEQKAI